MAQPIVCCSLHVVIVEYFSVFSVLAFHSEIISD
jgi:hypothetical protein